MLFCAAGSNACNFNEGLRSLCFATHHLEYSQMLPMHDVTKAGFSKDDFGALVDPYAASRGVPCT